MTSGFCRKSPYPCSRYKIQRCSSAEDFTQNSFAVDFGLFCSYNVKYSVLNEKQPLNAIEKTKRQRMKILCLFSLKRKLIFTKLVVSSRHS